MGKIIGKLILGILIILVASMCAVVAWGFIGSAYESLRGIRMDDMIVFLMLSGLCFAVWYGIAWIDTWKGNREDKKNKM